MCHRNMRISNLGLNVQKYEEGKQSYQNPPGRRGGGGGFKMSIQELGIPGHVVTDGVTQSVSKY